MTMRFFRKRKVPQGSTLRTWVDPINANDGEYSAQVEVEDFLGNVVLLDDITASKDRVSAHTFALATGSDYVVRCTVQLNTGSPQLKLMQTIVKADGSEYGKPVSLEIQLNDRNADRMLLLIEAAAV